MFNKINLRPFVELLKKKMSAERISKETLAKKLRGKKIPKKLEPKIEQAENKSQFFKEIKNKDKSNKNTKTKAKKLSVDLETIKQNNAIKKSEILESNESIPAVKEPLVKRSAQRVKTERVDVVKTTNQKVKNREKILSVELETIKQKEVIVKRNASKVKTEGAETSKNTNENKKQIIKEEGPSTSKKIKQNLSEEFWQPFNWKVMLDNIRNMRSNDNAPVDTMGCHKCADENADEKTQRFHKLIALMLSSQTKDETTYQAMLRLKENNLTPEVVCNMKINVLENILHPVSFYKNKAKYMQQTSKILMEKYNSDIPNNIKELIALPGVGPKMAHICMATAWHEVTGIGVDVHVHRISNRIGWLPKPTKDPEQTRVALETWLPKHLWSEVNHLLVGFGQTTCTPVKPKCSECLNFDICPSAMKSVKKKSV